MSWSTSKQVADDKEVGSIEVAYPLGPVQQQQLVLAKKLAGQIIRSGKLGHRGKKKAYSVSLSGHANDDPRTPGGVISVSVTQVAAAETPG
jgi:hypothetical protein